MDEFNNQNQPQEPWEQPEQPQEVQPEAVQTEPAANAYCYGEPAVQSAPQDYYYQQAPAAQSANNDVVLAVISLVCGILALIMNCFLFFITPLFSIAGLITGIISCVKKKGGKGMAIAGIICSGIALLLCIVLIVLMLIGFAAMGDPEFMEQFGSMMEAYGILMH